MLAELFLVDAYPRRKLEGAQVVLFHRMAADGPAVRCGQAIAWFPSPDVLLQMLMLHVARGLLAAVVRAKLASWADISDVALLKRLRNSEEWLRWLCIESFRENVASRLAEATSHAIRIVDGTTVRERGKTESQWRILYKTLGRSAISGRDRKINSA